MKKFLLLVAAATLALSATAATPKTGLQLKTVQESVQKIKAENALNGKLTATLKTEKGQAIASGALRAKSAVTPEGTPVPYIFSDYYNSAVSVKVSTSEDGSKVFFSNMFPYVYADEEAWVQGNVSTDGTSVTIPGDVVVAELATEDGVYPLIPVEMLVDDEGYITGVTELVFVKDGDKYYIDDDPVDPKHYIGLCAFDADGSFVGYYDYSYLIAYEPYTGPTEVVELPEGAVPADFIYMYYLPGLFGTTKMIETGQVYIDGNDVYMNLLTCGYQAWVKGTIEGNTATFPGGQYVDCGAFLTFQPICTDGTTDEEGYYIPVNCDYVMTYNPETNTFVEKTGDGLEYYTALKTQNDELYTYAYGYIVGTPIEGPAVPADPTDPELAYNDYYAQYMFYYTLDPVDVNGSFLNLDNLAYYIYLDDEIYTLTPDVFRYLTEEMTLIPYGFTENWDIYDGLIYVDESLLTSMGVQAVYTVDGETNYSNVACADLDGNQYVLPAPQLNPDGISNVTAKQITSVAIYDAEGRKLDAAQKGVNVVKMVAADGSVKTVKMYKK